MSSFTSNPLGYLGTPSASTTVAGKVELATVAECLAGTSNATVVTPLGLAAVAIAGAPAWSEATAGIVEKASLAEAQAASDNSVGMTPLRVANLLAAGNAPISVTTITGSGAVDIDTTGAISLDADAASNFSVAGAGVDLSLESAAGRVIVNGEEAAANAITLLSAAGGLDCDVALQLNLASSQNAADAVSINASAGGIELIAAGAAGEDIVLTNTAGSIHLTAGESASDAVNIDSSGGLDVDCVGQINIASSANGASAVTLTASVGGIDITATGAAAGEDINITATGSSVNVTSTEDAANAIYVHANGGTSETIKIHADQGTGVASIEVASDVGGLTLSSGLASADAINIVASNAAGGIDVDSGTAGIIVDTTGAISLDSAAASNFTVTGAFDLSLISTAGSLVMNAEEAVADALRMLSAAGGMDVNVALQMNLDSSQAAADAIRIIASNAAGGLDIDCGTGGAALDSTGAVSLQGAAASDFSVSGAGIDLTLLSAAGRVVVSGGEAAADGVRITASDVAGGIDIDSGTAGIAIDSTGAISIDAATASNFACAAGDMTIDSAAGSLILHAGESAADSIQITSDAGGIDITCSAAAAGEDIDISTTGSSINITASENVTDAIVINASGAASAMQLSSGTGSIRFASGIVVPATAVNNAASPYTVLGTDYFLAVDTGGGAVTVTLPAATALAGRTYLIRDVGGAAGASNITIGGGGTNLVGGGAAAASKTISTNYAGARVTSDGSVWAYEYIA